MHGTEPTGLVSELSTLPLAHQEARGTSVAGGDLLLATGVKPIFVRDRILIQSRLPPARILRYQAP
jgi:hypothetical protein